MNKPIIGITTDIDGEYLKLSGNYCEAVERTGGVPILLPVLDDIAYCSEIIDGLIIPGGADIDPSYYGEEAVPRVIPVPRKRSDFEISLLGAVLNLQKPVLGICYGMQLINVFFGGTLYQDIDMQVPEAIDHKEGHHTIVAENRFLGKGMSSVSSSHHQGIKALGRGLSAIAYSEDNLIEALTKEGYNFLIGIQWHPERSLHHELSMSVFRSFIKASHGL